jgi:hypothetical protein
VVSGAHFDKTHKKKVTTIQFCCHDTIACRVRDMFPPKLGTIHTCNSQWCPRLVGLQKLLPIPSCLQCRQVVVQVYKCPCFLCIIAACSPLHPPSNLVVAKISLTRTVMIVDLKRSCTHQMLLGPRSGWAACPRSVSLSNTTRLIEIRIPPVLEFYRYEQS